jgi:serine/threonine protein kinase
MSDQDNSHVGSTQHPGPAGITSAGAASERVRGAATGERAAGAVPRPGDRIHQYEILEMIGEGGMGTVFLARDLRLGRDVAIKFLQAGQPELTQRFLVEARTTARCQHDNIVVIHDVGEHDAAPYLVLELLHGTPLTRLTDGGQPVPYPRAVEILCSVLRALQCAHEHGIVHRDLKPDNIFLTAAGTIKVLDFGIAKVLPASPGGEGEPVAGAIRRARPGELTTRTDTGLTQAGTIVGTLAGRGPVVARPRRCRVLARRADAPGRHAAPRPGAPGQALRLCEQWVCRNSDLCVRMSSSDCSSLSAGSSK